MCGIAGFCGDVSVYQGSERKMLTEMLNVIIHRGPDGQGQYCDDKIYMGMRRLSIIDIDNGNQPIFNEDRTVVVVFNGEIYNYIELRSMLLQKGHKFSTKSDTEVIVHLYEEYGINFLSYLNGMFAIALWDVKVEKLILARDRTGEKPLHYYIKNNKVCFASEIKSILKDPHFHKEVNLVALNELLTYNYIPYPNTMFKDIFRLPPGNFLLYENGNVKIEQYWEIPYGVVAARSEKEICNDLIDLLEEATRIRLRSDVPLGAFLSGGIDSSTIVGLMSNLQKDNKIKTFSIGFEEEKFNELPYAEIVAKKFHTEHHTEIVKNTVLDILPETIWFCDNPHGDVSFLPTLRVSELASKHVKVVLTGDGSDELFAGYSKYVGFTEIFKGNDQDFINQYLNYTAAFSDELKAEICSTSICNVSDSSEPMHRILDNLKEQDVVTKMLYFDQKMLLEGNNLVKPDRMGMGRSIETRVPFLDHKFIEYVATIDSRLKLKGTDTKYILKKAIERLLPEKIIYRPKCMFTVPIGEWFKKELKDFMYKILTDELTLSRGYFNYEKVLIMMDEHVKGRKDYTRQLRMLIIIELWHRIFIDNEFNKIPQISDLVSWRL